MKKKDFFSVAAKYALFLLPLMFAGCRKSLTVPATTTSNTTVSEKTLQFTATAADTLAKLDVQIYDTNSGYVYYNSTGYKNNFSVQRSIVTGTSVTFVVNTNTVTNVASQITYNNKAVGVGAYNAAQDQGLVPSITLYYKVP